MKQDNYEDIINLPHHTSSNHARMNRELRAAQFAPFAALTGYDSAIKETARITDNRIELTDEEKLKLNDILKNINDNIIDCPKVTITYFNPDDKKDGGKYLTCTGNVKKIEQIDQRIVLTDKTKIKISEIININVIQE